MIKNIRISLNGFFSYLHCSTEKYYVDDGCHDPNVEKIKPDDVVGFYQSENLKAGVRCCSMDGSKCETPGRCNGRNGITFSEAVDECTGMGLKLCTKEELLSEVCCATGGNCDSFAVWTSTPGIVLQLI